MFNHAGIPYETMRESNHRTFWGADAVKDTGWVGWWWQR